MSDRDETRLATRVVHAASDPDPAYGGVAPGIHQSSTYVVGAGRVAEYQYSRAGNPTRAVLEAALGELEGGLASAFASGMAAAHAVFTAVCEPGDHVLLHTDLYGGTYALLTRVLERWGIEFDLVDQREPAAVAAALRPRTRLVWVESPTNPRLDIIDIAAITAASGDAVVCVDNTFATPIVQRPLELGAQAVVHSTTKYLGGHSDTIGGAVVVRDPGLHQRVREVQASVGGVPGPFDCFLVHRGIRTLHLRVAAHTESGRAVSEFLRTAAGVTDVRWPGFGGMVAFRHPAAGAIAAETRIFALAGSLGGVESLIEVPARMSHRPLAGSAAALPDDLLRLSCGIEDPADLVADLRQAIANAG